MQHPNKIKAIQIKRIAKKEKLTYHAAQANYEMLKSTGHLEEYMAELDKEVKRPKEEEHYCPDCNKIMNLIQGKNGWFYGCPNYPDCRRTKSVDVEPLEDKPIDADQLKTAQGYLQEAINYVTFVGGIATAKKFLALAERMLE